MTYNNIPGFYMVDLLMFHLCCPIIANFLKENLILPLSKSKKLSSKHLILHIPVFFFFPKCDVFMIIFSCGQLFFCGVTDQKKSTDLK